MTTAAPTFDSADELIIETPERVELYYTRAQVGNRFLAAIVDHLIQAVLIGGLALVLWLVGGWIEYLASGLGNWALALAILACFAVYAGYFIVFETLWNGQTPGKRLFRLRVIREDGRPIRFYEATVRNLLRVGIDSQPSLLYSVGIVSIFLSSRSKRLGDYVAGTVVIRESEAKSASLEDVVRLARGTDADRRRQLLEAAPFVIDPRKLGPTEVQALRSFLRRRYDLPDDARRSLGYRIVVSLAALCEIPPVPLSPEAVLEEIDRQLRAHRDRV